MVFLEYSNHLTIKIGGKIMHIHAQQYLSLRKNLTPLKGKVPIKSNWTSLCLNLDVLNRHDGNFGWVLGVDDLVIDVDPRNGGAKSYFQLLEHLQQYNPSLELNPTVHTPSGGFHVYLSIPSRHLGRGWNKTIKEYPGIDFLTKGSQCVIAGSTTPDGKYTIDDDLSGQLRIDTAPTALLELIAKDTLRPNTRNASYGDFTGLISGSGSNVNIKDIHLMLEAIDPSIGYEDWVKVGMALHDWSPQEGLALWDSWSKGSSNYREGECKSKWKSFHADSGVTLGTLKYLSDQAKKDIVRGKIDRFKKEIDDATIDQLNEEIIPAIGCVKLEDMDLDILSSYIHKRFLKLGVTIRLGVIRKSILESEAPVGKSIPEEAPEWIKEWVYIVDQDRFADIKNKTLYKKDGFNLTVGKHIPASKSGSKPSAHKYVCDTGYLRQVDSTSYLPFYDEAICHIAGKSYYNTFDSSTVPEASPIVSAEARVAIEAIKLHIQLIIGDEVAAEIFTQWLAHQVQYPGKLVLWAPLIQSAQGLGKSFFSSLLCSVLGNSNVGVVGSKEINSGYTGWATDRMVNVIEEMKITGKNRYEAANAIKPFITNEWITVHPKHVNMYNAYNTTNYICLTNYKDAIPLERGDRRWFVIFSPIDSIEELEQLSGIPRAKYFQELFDSLDLFGPEIRQWLLDYPISDDFKDIKQAPVTESKEAMICTEEANIEGLSELRTLIEQGGPTWNENVVCSSDLFNQFMFDYPEVVVSNQSKGVLLKRLGFTKFKHPIKFEGRSIIAWTKKVMSNRAIVRSFKVVDDDLDNL
jgi:hypothetical protein